MVDAADTAVNGVSSSSIVQRNGTLTENGGKRPGSPADEPAAKRARLDVANGSHGGDDKTTRYRTGLFLAPMVRIGTLTTRLIALENGAALVWGPEIVDKAMIGAKRVECDGGVIRYEKTAGSAIWETHPIEKSRLIYQLGTSDPALAVEAAKTVEGDVSGIDLNCGCPKPFSTHSGMGAALLSTPDLLCDILTALVANIKVPISCKIRLLPEQEPTLALVRRICATGISNLTVHCRTRDMRDRQPALLHRLRDVVGVAAEFGIPVVANGDCFSFADGERIREQTGVTSIMIARGAEANPTCFRADGPRHPLEYIIPTYLRLARWTAHSFANVKYVLAAQSLAPLSKKQRTPHKDAITRSKSLDELCRAFAIDPNERQSVEELCPTLAASVRAQDAHAPMNQLNGGEGVEPAAAFALALQSCDPTSITFADDQPVISDPTTDYALRQAAQALRDGALVAFPTETVYGLGANATKSDAVKSIFETKGRPVDNPLIVHVASRAMLKSLVAGAPLPACYDALIDAFWPGPLSLLVQFGAEDAQRTGIAAEVTANLPSLVVRMPSHPIARALIALADVPVAAPSANRSGRPSPTTAQHIVADYQGRQLPGPVTVLDGGSCDVGLESTVVDAVTEPGVLRVLRPGGIGPDQLRSTLDQAGLTDWTVRVFGQDWTDDSLKSQPPTPGMKYRHYAPDAAVVMLNVVEDESAPMLHDLVAGRRAALLAPEPSSLSAASIAKRSLGNTAGQHAQRLFAGLRELDTADAQVIFIERPSGSDWSQGIGLAVGERAGKAGSNAPVVRVRAQR